MTKLSNGFHYHNPKLPAEFAEYLLHNLFLVKTERNVLHFSKGPIEIRISGNCLDIYVYDPILLMAHEHVFSVTGLNKLDLNRFILLMHSTGAQNISEFPANAAVLDKQLGAEAKFIVETLIHLLQIKKSETKKSIPAYS